MPPLKLGVIFPQTECGTDVAAIGEFVRAVETLGFDHLFVADHVLGAEPKFHSHPSLATYSHEAVVHEALTLMAYLTAITRRLTLATGILILPQRQTALVAKQAAQIDVLSGGRLRLGIGVGWNAVEFEALNETFENRGRRSAEQIGILRAVDAAGRGLSRRVPPDQPRRPQPHARPAADPHLVRRGQPGPPGTARRGAAADRAARRRLEPELRSRRPGPDPRGSRARLRSRGGSRSGRAPAGGAHPPGRPGPRWMGQEVNAWKALGATSVIAEPRNAGLRFPDGHLDALRRFKETTKEAA